MELSINVTLKYLLEFRFFRLDIFIGVIVNVYMDIYFIYRLCMCVY